jgi:predicted outer membrane protein
MVELRDAVKRSFNEVQEPAALSERLKDVLIDQQSGRKIFDSREEINRKAPPATMTSELAYKVGYRLAYWRRCE